MVQRNLELGEAAAVQVVGEVADELVYRGELITIAGGHDVPHRFRERNVGLESKVENGSLAELV
jgi:hypothetical protein